MIYGALYNSEFILSFIKNICIAPFQQNYSETLPTPLLSMPLSQPGLITVARFMLASRLDWGSWIGSAARLIGRIPKFRHVSGYMLVVLHRLPSGQWIAHRIAALVWRNILSLAPAYLCELCCPVLSARGSRSLRSSEQGLLVPFARTTTMRSRWWVPRPGMTSLWIFAFLGPSLLCSFLTVKLFSRPK